MEVHPGVFVSSTSTDAWRSDLEVGGGAEEHVLSDTGRHAGRAYPLQGERGSRSAALGAAPLLVGFPTLFAIVPALQWLGIQGGMREWVAVVLLTLSLNGTLLGAVIGAAITLRSPGHWNRIGSES